MDFYLTIKEGEKGYHIVAINEKTTHVWALFSSRDIDTIKTQLDYLVTLFGCEVR